jgi:hypothetical protein
MRREDNLKNKTVHKTVDGSHRIHNRNSTMFCSTCPTGPYVQHGQCKVLREATRESLWEQSVNQAHLVRFEVFTALTMKRNTTGGGEQNLSSVLKVPRHCPFVLEECSLLGYKNPGRTSQETHYVSATETSRLMLCKISGFHSSDYEECRLLGYKNPIRTSQETHYVSATETSRLVLFKVWGFHGVDYEEWRILGCWTPIRTSQEAHYLSASESSRLMLCKIWGFHGSDYEECSLLGCYAVWLL